MKSLCHGSLKFLISCYPHTIIGFLLKPAGSVELGAHTIHPMEDGYFKFDLFTVPHASSPTTNDVGTPIFRAEKEMYYELLLSLPNATQKLGQSKCSLPRL